LTVKKSAILKPKGIKRTSPVAVIEAYVSHKFLIFLQKGFKILTSPSGVSNLYIGFRYLRSKDAASEYSELSDSGYSSVKFPPSPEYA